ncbi:MAG: dihydrofolate reductase [Devosia sp.]
MPLEIIGHAIVSAEGAIAGPDGLMPPQLHNAADWQRFQDALDRAALVVVGRLGHEAHPNPGRLRLVPTGRVARIELDPSDPRAIFWNPAALDFEAVLHELGIGAGEIAVTGGTRVFDYFIDRFTQFDLVRMPDVKIPGGIPCFSAGDPRAVLSGATMTAVKTVALGGGAILTIWRR